MIKRYVVKIEKFAPTEYGGQRPVLPWDEMAGLNVSWFTAFDPEKNEFPENYVMAVVAGKASDHVEIAKNPNVFELPDPGANGKVSDVAIAKRQEVAAKAAEVGVDVADVKLTDDWSVMLNKFGKKLRAQFESSVFDVPDVRAEQGGR